MRKDGTPPLKCHHLSRSREGAHLCPPGAVLVAAPPCDSTPEQPRRPGTLPQPPPPHSIRALSSRRWSASRLFRRKWLTSGRGTRPVTGLQWQAVSPLRSWLWPPPYPKSSTSAQMDVSRLAPCHSTRRWTSPLSSASTHPPPPRHQMVPLCPSPLTCLLAARGSWRTLPPTCPWPSRLSSFRDGLQPATTFAVDRATRGARRL